MKMIPPGNIISIINSYKLWYEIFEKSFFQDRKDFACFFYILSMAEIVKETSF